MVTHVLAMTLSNYSLVELDWYQEGFTKGITERKIMALQEKVASTAELLLDDLDL